MFLTAYYYANYLSGDENIILDSSLIDTGVNANQTENYLQVFPNPSSGIFSASILSGVTDIVAVAIYAIDGRKIKTLNENFSIEAGKNKLECNSMLADGIYFLRMKGQKINAVQKIVVIN